ncbi:hypothetical protein [uncultured Eudoraea sp.]|uniref:hypothetical protein n=1 Tax=uncultured Eudoraea sp. TaxID=1035614 RepID=UPI002633C222|nr:hypothetical protein [uncultured Eudoraea sp.]
MKTNLKFTAMIAFMFITAVGLAKEPKVSLLTEGQSKSLIVALDSKNNKTILKIIDENQNIIFSEKISVNSYTKKFDLDKLENGSYLFELDDSLRTLTYTIRVENEEVKILRRIENNKPIFRKIGAKLYLNLLNLDSKDVEIKVFDSDNRTLFSEVVENENIVSKAFNFETARKDHYTIVVKDGENTYYEDIVVN